MRYLQAQGNLLCRYSFVCVAGCLFLLIAGVILLSDRQTDGSILLSILSLSLSLSLSK